MLAAAPALSCFPFDLHAQTFQSSFAIGSGIANVSPTNSGGVLLAAPRLDFAIRGFTLRMDGRASWTGAEYRSTELIMGALLREAAWGPFRWTGHFDARADHFSEGSTHARARAGAALQYAHGGTSLILRGDVGAARVDGIGGFLVRAGAGVRSGGGRRRAELVISTTSYASPRASLFADTAIGADTTFARRTRGQTLRATYSQAELRLDWRGNGWSARLEMGGRMRGDLDVSETWIRAHGEKRLLPNFDLLLSGGWTPSEPERGLAGRPVATLAIRMATSPSSPAARPSRPRDSGVALAPVTHIAHLDGNRRVLRIPAARARSVEIMADFTDWKPIALRREDDVYWAIAIELPPGHYRINARIDGRPWTVPPGLAAIPDEFGGLAGALLIE